MGPGQPRIEGQRAIEMGHGLGHTPDLAQHEGEQAMRVAVARMERQQAFQKLDGGGGLRGPAQQVGEIEHRVAIVRPQLDRRPIGGDGGLGLLQPPERIAEVVMGVGKLRPERRSPGGIARRPRPAGRARAAHCRDCSAHRRLAGSAVAARSSKGSASVKRRCCARTTPRSWEALTSPGVISRIRR